MAVLRPCSASLCLTPFLESSSLLGPALLESVLVKGPSRSTRRSLIGASSPPSSARTAKSQTLSVQTACAKGSERLLTSGVHEHVALCLPDLSIGGIPSGYESGTAHIPCIPSHPLWLRQLELRVAIATLTNSLKDGHNRGKKSHLPIGGDLL
jgi:hypothetical protein